MRPVKISFLALALFLMSSCSPFSDLQTARTAGEGKLELTPFISGRANTSEEESIVDPVLGAHLAYGLAPKTDIRLSMRATVLGMYIHAGPKFGLWENRLSVYVPVGTLLTWGDNFDGNFAAALAEIQPTLLYTQPLIKDQLEWNFSSKWIQRFGQVPLGSYAFNTSLSFGKNLRKRAFIVEYGTMGFADGELRNSTVNQFSFGIVFKM